MPDFFVQIEVVSGVVLFLLAFFMIRMSFVTVMFFKHLHVIKTFLMPGLKMMHNAMYKGCKDDGMENNDNGFADMAVPFAELLLINIDQQEKSRNQRQDFKGQQED